MPPLSRLLVAVTVLTLATSAAAAAQSTPESCPILQLFLSVDDPSPTQVRALRHLEAHNEKFERTAFMDVWTEASSDGFSYTIADQGGSEYIRDKVLLPTLEAEKRMWGARVADRAALTPDNYTFEDRGARLDGLVAIGVKPRRKDISLIDGVIYVRPDDGELVRSEGRLAKSPSFWTRRVEIVRRYNRVAGIRMPISVHTVANVLIAGRSTFSMTYQYESINGQRVGSPQLRRTAEEQ